MLHGTGHYQATGPRQDQQIDPSNQQTWAIHAICHPSIQKGIQRVLVSQFNPSDPGKGMVKLLDDGDSILTRVQSTDAITAGSVLKSAKKRADKLSTTTGKTIHQSIRQGTNGTVQLHGLVYAILLCSLHGIVRRLHICTRTME